MFLEAHSSVESLNKTPLNFKKQENDIPTKNSEIDNEYFKTPTVLKSKPSSSDFNPITPLRFSDEDDEEVSDGVEENAHSMKTPTSTYQEVDFTPLKTPWRKQAEVDENFMTKVSEQNSKSHQGIDDLLMFTPQPSDIARPNTEKSKLDLFLKNNKAILQGLNSRSQTSLDDVKDENEENTPVTTYNQDEEFKRNNLINFITPFKSPIGSPGSITSPSTNRMNISAQDVDDFIDEVISNTSKTPKGIYFLLVIQSNLDITLAC